MIITHILQVIIISNKKISYFDASSTADALTHSQVAEQAPEKEQLICTKRRSCICRKRAKNGTSRQSRQCTESTRCSGTCKGKGLREKEGKIAKVNEGYPKNTERKEPTLYKSDQAKENAVLRYQAKGQGY